MNVLVTGTISFDYIMDFPEKFSDRIMPEKIHALSLSFLVDTLQKQFGGTSCNIAYSLRLLGVRPTVVSCAGNDFGPYGSYLRKHDVATSGIIVKKDSATGSYFVITDENDNQIGAYYVGASKYNENISLRPYAGPSHRPFTVISPNTPRAFTKYANECIALGFPYLYDPAFQISQIPPKDLQKGITHAQILIGNDYEIALMEKRLGIDHKTLVSFVPIVITTLGPKGSIVEKGREKYCIAAARVKKATDPTGAGDAYRAGFLAGYLRKLDLRTCGQMGSVAAAYTVEKYGTITHIYTRREFIRRYRNNYNTDIDLKPL